MCITTPKPKPKTITTMKLTELFRIYLTGKTPKSTAYLMARCHQLHMVAPYFTRPFIGPVGQLP